MKKNTAIICLAALLLAGCATPAKAQAPPCTSRAAWMARLAAEYGELVIWTGVTTSAEAGSRNIVTELVTNPAGTSWTIMRYAHGTDMACLIGSGTSWGVPSLPILGTRL